MGSGVGPNLASAPRTRLWVATMTGSPRHPPQTPNAYGMAEENSVGDGVLSLAYSKDHHGHKQANFMRAGCQVGRGMGNSQKNDRVPPSASPPPGVAGKGECGGLMFKFFAQACTEVRTTCQNSPPPKDQPSLMQVSPSRFVSLPIFCEKSTRTCEKVSDFGRRRSISPPY